MSGKYWQAHAYTTPLPPAIELLSLEEMVARIEAARLEEAPARCTACGTETSESVDRRRCCLCGIEQPLTAFSRNKSEPRGYGYRCRACKRAQDRAFYGIRKRERFLAILGRTG